MSAYTLYYWPLPFRGAFIRTLLRHTGQDVHEPGFDEVSAFKLQEPQVQPVPAMAPPFLVDHDDGLTLAQFPAILRYLGTKHGLMPDDIAEVALIDKLICDANDVLDELTLFGGRSMWTMGEWQSFVEDRLPRWMRIFETSLAARGDSFWSKSDAPDLGDIVIAVLWGVMTRKFTDLKPLLDRHAPLVSRHADRVLGLPGFDEALGESDQRFGDLYCGGQIEASIRDMLERHGI